MKETLRLVFVLGLLVALGSCSSDRAGSNEAKAVEVRFDPGVRYQTIEGWGGRFPNASGLPLAEIQQEMVDGLGLTRVGIELTTWNLMGLADDEDPPQVDMTGFDYPVIDRYARDVVLPLREKVEARGEELVLYLTVVWTTRPSVMHRDPAEYAKYLLGVLRRFRDGGVEVDYWVIENEPDFRTGPFWTPDKLGRFIAYLGERMRAEGFQTRFAAPEVVTPNQVGKWLAGIAATPGARAYLGEITFHSYDYDPSMGEAPPALPRMAVAQWGRRLGLPIAQTEQGAAGKKNRERWQGKDMRLGLDLAINLWADLTWAEVSAWEPHVVFTRNEDGSRWVGGGFFEVDTSGTVTKRDHYWVLRQFTRYVRAGAVRVRTQVVPAEGSVRSVGFLSPNGAPVLVLINPQSAPVVVNISGLPAGPLRSTVTASGRAGAEQALAPAEAGASYRLDLPGGAVVTLWRP